MPKFKKKGGGGKSALSSALEAGPAYTGFPQTKAPPSELPVRSSGAMKKKLKGGR